MRRRAILISWVVILVAILGGIGYGVIRNAQQETAEATLPTPVATSTTSAATVSSTPLTSSSPVASPTAVVPSTSLSTMTRPTLPPAIQPVLQSPPTHMTITTKPGLVVDAKVGAMDYRDDLAAPSCSEHPDDLDCPNTAYWIQNRLGVAPGSSTDKATYIMGHSWTQGHRVFDELSDYAMKHYDPAVISMPSTDRNGGVLDDVETRAVPTLEGSTIVLTTATGTLTYSVQKVYIVRKVDVGRFDDFRKGAPNRLTIDTCGIDLQAGVDTEFAVLIFADLTAAVPL